MAASSQTQNYQLPQWEADDPILRTDFNAAMAALDAALKAVTSATPVIGTYVGDGKMLAEGGQAIELGFRPRFVIVDSKDTNGSSTARFCHDFATNGCNTAFVAITDTGFLVYSPATPYSMHLNEANATYAYVAFP